MSILKLAKAFDPERLRLELPAGWSDSPPLSRAARTPTKRQPALFRFSTFDGDFSEQTVFL